MNEYSTKGVSTSGFQSIDQEGGLEQTRSGNEQHVGGGDHLGIRYWPQLFQYLEDHFVFSASVLGVIGYVIIASFGAMQTIGQYVGYTLFLCGVAFIYSLGGGDEKRKSLYFFMATTFLFFGWVVIQNWSSIISYYNLINQPFVPTNTELLAHPPININNSN